MPIDPSRVKSVRQKYRFLMDRSEVRFKSLQNACRKINVGTSDLWMPDEVDQLFEIVLAQRAVYARNMQVGEARKSFAERDIPTQEYTEELGGFDA